MIGKETILFLQEKLIDNDFKTIIDYSDEEEQKRYWGIKEFAKVLCSGTHLYRTIKLGKLNLKKKEFR